ncbi:MAG: hypothetical protein Q9191_006358 [Dirinaria sp. TL-2023a]
MPASRSLAEKSKGSQKAQIKIPVAEAWTYEFGAGQASLDFELRDSSHTRQQIVSLMEDMLRRLQGSRDVLAGNHLDRKHGIDNAEPIDERDADDLGLQAQLELLQESFAEIINRLFQVSMLIRKPMQDDFLICANSIDITAFEQSDLEHVRDRFPKAEEILMQRLGKNLARRRKYLKYGKRTLPKSSKGSIDSPETARTRALPVRILREILNRIHLQQAPANMN